MGARSALTTVVVLFCTSHFATSSSIAKDTDKSGPRYVYTRPSTTYTGRKCIGDCIRDYCIVDFEGTLNDCVITKTNTTTAYYTSLVKQDSLIKCRSACVKLEGKRPLCFVTEKGDVDYCNPYLPLYDDRQPLASVEENKPRKCLTVCKYTLGMGFRCHISGDTVDVCAPFAYEDRFSLIDDHSSGIWGKCVSAPPLAAISSKIQKRVKRDNRRRGNRKPIRQNSTAISNPGPSDENHYDIFTCAAEENPDNVDTLRSPDARGILVSMPTSSVSNDAEAFHRLGTTNWRPPSPLLSVTTIYNIHLELNLPTVVSARIDRAALESVDGPRPSNGIRRAVPSLVNALSTISYSIRNMLLDIGHMVAFCSGGPDADFNFAPQAATVNRGIWLQMENFIREWVLTGGPQAYVDMLIVVYYDTELTYMPIAFGVNLIFYYAENQVASVCNDMAFFNHGNGRRNGRGRRRGRREVYRNFNVTTKFFN